LISTFSHVTELERFQTHDIAQTLNLVLVHGDDPVKSSGTCRLTGSVTITT